MRLTHDAEADAAYVYLVDEINRGEVASSHVADIPMDRAALTVDLDADGRAPGLTRPDDRTAPLDEPLLEQARLRGLAGTVAALEGDEQSAAHAELDFFERVEVVRFAVVVRLARGAAGPLSRLICSSSAARSNVMSSTDSPRGIVAFVVPSVT